MNLKEKVFRLRAQYKREKVFYINNPAAVKYEYFGIFETRGGELNYDFAHNTTELWKLRKERFETRVSRKYSILSKNQFIKFWFEYQFWQYCLLWATSIAEKQHYQHKISRMKFKLF